MSFNITPLDQVSRDALRDMAQAAADAGEPLSTANVFALAGLTSQARHFDHDYHARNLALADD